MHSHQGGQPTQGPQARQHRTDLDRRESCEPESPEPVHEPEPHEPELVPGLTLEPKNSILG